MKKIYSLISLLFAFAANIWASPGDVITSLDQISPNKTYNIENLRGRLRASTQTPIVATDDLYFDSDDDDQRFFIIPDEKDGVSGFYLFSVSQNKFLCSPGLSFSDVPVFMTISDETESSGSEQYRWFIHEPGSGTHLNLGGNTFKFDTWTTPDDGNRNMITEAGSKDTDPDPSSLIGSTRPILFHLSYAGIERNTVAGEGVIGGPVPLPTQFANPLLAFSAPTYAGEPWDWLDENDAPIVPTQRQAREDTLNVYYEATWGADFQLSTSFADAKWYNMDVRRSAAPKDDEGNPIPMYVHYSEDIYPYECATVGDPSLLMMPSYKWALIGNPFDGLMVINQAAGEGKYLQPDTVVTNNVGMFDGEYVWNVVGVTENATLPPAIVLTTPNATNRINQRGGAAGPLGLWEGGPQNDPGNYLRFTEAPVTDKELTKVTLNATYNGETLRTAVIDAFVGNPLSTLVLPKTFDNGLVTFDYDLDALITADMVLDIPIGFKLDIALDKSKWYNLDVRDGAYYLNATPTGEKANYYPIDAFVVAPEDLNSALYQWAFEGNPYEVRIYNRAYGDKTLTRYADPNNGNKAVASMRDGQYTWNLYSSEDAANGYFGMALEASDAKGNYLNQEGGAGDNKILGFYTNRNESGSRVTAVEVQQVADPVTMVDITYHLMYNGEEVRKVSAVLQCGEFLTMPASFSDPLLTIDFEAKDAEGTVVENVPADVNNFDVYYTAEWGGLFELSTSFADAHWYNMDIRRAASEGVNGIIYVSYGTTLPYRCKPVVYETIDGDGFTQYVEDTNKRALNNYQWAFIGDPFKGIMVINKAAGEGMSLAVNADPAPEVLPGEYYWTIGGVDKNDGWGVGFYLKTPDANNYINQKGGNTGDLVIWVGGSGTDDGSILRLSEVPECDKPQTTVTLNGIFNGEVIKTGTIYAYVGDLLGDCFSVPADWDNGLVTFDYDATKVITEGMTVDVTINFNFDIALDGSKWYNLDIRNEWWVNTERVVTATGAYMPEDKADLTTRDLEENPAYLWAFKGTPYGVNIYNAAFPGMTLAKTDVNGHMYAIMQPKAYDWTFYANGDGFSLEYSDWTGNYINQEGGSGDQRPLGNYTNKGDGGCRFHAIEQPYAYFEGMDTFWATEVPTSIGKINGTANSTTAIFSINGMRTNSLSKGLNIVRRADGRVVKVMVK